MNPGLKVHSKIYPKEELIYLDLGRDLCVAFIPSSRMTSILLVLKGIRWSHPRLGDDFLYHFRRYVAVSFLEPILKLAEKE